VGGVHEEGTHLPMKGSAVFVDAEKGKTPLQRNVAISWGEEEGGNVRPLATLLLSSARSNGVENRRGVAGE